MADVNFVYVNGVKYDIADLIARQSAAEIEAQKGEPNGIAPLDGNGNLAVSAGGTGSSSAKGAQYNLLGDMNTDEGDISDTTEFVSAYATASVSIGAVMKRTALKIYNYILSKLPIGVANGIATLDATGRVPYGQLPVDAMTFEGSATPATPTPDDPVKGMFWIVAEAGTVFGVPDCEVDDRLIYDGNDFVLLPSGVVKSVNGKTGDVVLTAADIGSVSASWNASSHTLTLVV